MEDLVKDWTTMLERIAYGCTTQEECEELARLALMMLQEEPNEFQLPLWAQE